MAESESSIEKYLDLLINLLPKGRLWQPKAQPVLKALLRSWASEFCRVEDAVTAMLRDVDPRTTVDLLEDWERVLGLPDECTPENQTELERINQVTQKFTNVGGLSKEFFEFLGTQLGFDITIDSALNFVAGRATAGDRLTNYFNRRMLAGDGAGTLVREAGWRPYFIAELPVTAATVFVAGSVAGEPLRTFSNELVECTIRKLKPAHSAVSFIFKV